MWQVLPTRNHNNLLFFTSLGRVFRLPVWEIPESSRTAKGQSLANFLQLSENETVTAVLDETAGSGKFLFFCTKKGVVKKTAVENFQNVRKSGLIAIGLKPGDFLGWVKFASENDTVFLVTRDGKSIHFPENDVRAMGRTAAGVRGIRLRKSDLVVEMDVVHAGEDSQQLLVVMENGLGKMTSVQSFRLQGRGGTGVKCANLNSKTGAVAGAKVLRSQSPTSSLILLTRTGQSIMMAASEIPSRGRATQGVILMRLPKGDKVVNVGVIEVESES